MAFSGLPLGAFAVLLCSSTVAATPVQIVARALPGEDFHSFVRHYNRPFAHGSREFEDRRVLFNQRVAQVHAQNGKPGRLWTAAINHLADRTEAELAQLRGWRGAALPGGGQQAQPRAGRTFLRQSARAKPLPRECMNWTRLHTTTNVIDQGGCGSCWAVTATTVLQAHLEIYSPGSNRTFSTQELLSCVPNPHSCGGEGGCQGATVELAFAYVTGRGLKTAAETPYHAITGSCARRPASAVPSSMTEGTDGQDDAGSIELISKPGRHAVLAALPRLDFGMKAWERLPENRYEPLLRAVYERGPVAVSVAASGWSFYGSGIFNGCAKDAEIDHAVTLIGFGEGAGSEGAAKEQFWLILNSWGGSWGEQGRIRLLRRDSDEAEQCGVDHKPEVGTGCKGGPKQVKVCGMCGILYDSVVPHFAA